RRGSAVARLDLRRRQGRCRRKALAEGAETAGRQGLSRVPGPVQRVHGLLTGATQKRATTEYTEQRQKKNKERGSKACREHLAGTGRMLFFPFSSSFVFFPCIPCIPWLPFFLEIEESCHGRLEEDGQDDPAGRWRHRRARGRGAAQGAVRRRTHR